jgi:nicotinamidase-related amidase
LPYPSDTISSASDLSGAAKGIEQMSDIEKTALVLIGFQNDYMDPDGILQEAIEDNEGRNKMLENVLKILDTVEDEPVVVIHTPIIFTENYDELIEPTGILKLIKDKGAFKQGCSGSETIQEFDKYADNIVVVPGKRGLNAFSNTNLHEILQNEGVTRVVLAGVVTSICIDSAGRAAHDYGYKVTVLSDATCGRNSFEQQFYCENIFPLYADVCETQQFLESVGVSV